MLDPTVTALFLLSCTTAFIAMLLYEQREQHRSSKQQNKDIEDLIDLLNQEEQENINLSNQVNELEQELNETVALINSPALNQQQFTALLLSMNLPLPTSQELSYTCSCLSCQRLRLKEALQQAEQQEDFELCQAINRHIKDIEQQISIKLNNSQ